MSESHPTEPSNTRGGTTASPELSSGSKSNRNRIWVLLVVLVALGALAFFLRKGEMQEQQLQKLSLTALEQKNIEAKTDPLIALVYGEKLVKAGRNDDAIRVFATAHKALPESARDPIAERLLARFGHSLAVAGQIEDAQTLLDRARKINGDDPIIYLGYGLIFLQKNLASSAIAQFELAANLDPTSTEAWFLLGKTSNENRAPEKAIPYLEKALALTPTYAPIEVELGHSYAFQTQFPQAVVHFKKASELDPSSEEYRRLYGLALAMTARTRAEYDEVLQILAKNIKESPDNSALLFSIAQLHMRFNAIDQALPLLQKAVQLTADDAQIWYNLSLAERRAGNTAAADKANAEFQRLSRLHDGVAIAEKKVAADLTKSGPRLELAREYRQAGNYVGAYWQLWIAIRMLPDRADLRKEFEEVGKQYQKLRGSSLAADDPKSMGPPPPPEIAKDLDPKAMGKSTGAPANTITDR